MTDKRGPEEYEPTMPERVGERLAERDAAVLLGEARGGPPRDRSGSCRSTKRWLKSSGR
jgi:hypothetical protein